MVPEENDVNERDHDDDDEDDADVTCNQPETSDDKSDDVIEGDASDLTQPGNILITVTKITL